MSQTNVCCDDRCCHWATGGDGTAHVSQQSNRERGQEELRFTVLRTFSADLINIYRHTWTDPDFEVPLAALQTPSCHQHPVDIRDHGRMICSYDISKGTQKLPRSKVKYFPKTRFNVHVQRCKFGANPTGVALDHACDARKAKTFLLLFPHTASAKEQKSPLPGSLRTLWNNVYRCSQGFRPDHCITDFHVVSFLRASDPCVSCQA